MSPFTASMMIPDSLILQQPAYSNSQEGYTTKSETWVWRLVPGDAIRSYSLDYHDLTPKQEEEKKRYDPCCLCRRTIYEIREFGCDNYTCRQQGLPSMDQAAKKRELRMRREEAEPQV